MLPDTGARSLAIPCIGCGVNGWEPARVAHEALHAAAEWMRGGMRGGDTGGEAAGAASLRRVDFVVSSDATWGAFTRRAEVIFGPADESPADPAARHILQWSEIWSGGGPGLACAPKEVVHVRMQDAQRSRNARRRAGRRDSARAVRAERGLTRTEVSVPRVPERTSNRAKVRVRGE